LSSNNGGGDCEAPQATKLALIVIQARSQQQRSFGCARKKNGGAEPRRLSPVSRNQRQSALDVLCRLAALGFFGVFFGIVARALRGYPIKWFDNKRLL